MDSRYIYGQDRPQRAADGLRLIYAQLFHALMALTALSMDNRGGVQNLDALQHYQKAIPSLKSILRTSEDLSSDVAFLTHFILLLYEVRISGSQEERFRLK